MTKTPVGYKAISEKLAFRTLPHYRESYVASQGRGKVIIEGYHEIHIYPKTYALKNESDLLEHLEFALKHDGINLEIIKTLFEQMDKSVVVTYIKDQSTRIYPRKIWYLYEFLMNEELPLESCKKVKHIDLVDSTLYFTSAPIKSSRHAVNDNLLGNQQFCPLIRRTKKLETYIESNLDKQAKALLDKYDSRLIARACNYLYTKETMSSYQIEKEQPDKTRLTRFITLLQQAHTIETLSKNKLIELQNTIVDARFSDADYRHNQNYVGENINPYYQKIHYISPKPEDVSALMQGLLDALNKMLINGIHPVIIAAAISFGFVFIHPFEDGNGRIHRFLIHHILSKTDFTPKDIIFPISSVMLENMRIYDQALELFSKPLLDILTDYHLTDEGIMTVQQSSQLHYQYIDFTAITEYLFSCIEDAVNNYLERELVFLENYDKAKKAIQDVIDMPDNQIDLLIKLILQNKGGLSENKRDRFFSLLTENEIKKLTQIINDTMIKKINI